MLVLVDTKVDVQYKDGGVRMERAPRGVFTKEFKEEAVKLVINGGLSIPEAGRRLSIPKSTLPEPLNEHIIHPAAPSIHANPYVMFLENTGKSVRGKLTSLIGVEYPGRPIERDRLFEDIDTEGGVESV